MAVAEAGNSDRLHMAGSVGGERLLTGIVNSDARFRAPSSADRLSRLDPLLPAASRKAAIRGDRRRAR